jgi:hypothetical protein
MLEWWKPIAIILMLPSLAAGRHGFDDAKSDLGCAGGAGPLLSCRGRGRGGDPDDRA